MKVTVETVGGEGARRFEEELLALSEKIGKPKETRLGPNRFAAFRANGRFEYLSFIPGRGEIRRIVGSCDENLPLPEESPHFERRSETLLCQIDLDNRRIDCGMSYLFRLGDGRFFLIDGGYFTYRECDRLYRLLRKLQPEGKLVLAGWFFSHAHQDHLGCFLDFAARYAGEKEEPEKADCVIEGLYYTFPSLSLPEAAFWKQSDNATIREFYDTLARFLPHVPRYALHTGQSFFLADLSADVLFTHEDIYPERIYSFNDSSTVLRVRIAGQTLLFLGDLQEASCRKLEAMYGNELKADLVQVAHHGFNGSTAETYDLASPTVALWPTPDYGFIGNRERQVNAHLLSMPSVREHLVAGIHGTRILPLPYTPASSLPVDLPKD